MNAGIRYGRRLAAVILFLAALFDGEVFAQSQIYRCMVDGAVVFADRPCGNDAEPYDASDALVSSYEPTPVSNELSGPAPKRVATTVRRETVPDRTRQAQSCAKLERALSDIRAKQRAGYTAKQGKRLRERQQKLAAQRRELRC
jgi:hypothetical protein